jgi:hypothetical protein
MTFQSTRFDMSGVMNKLRAIAEAKPMDPAHMDEPDPGMETGGKEIDTAAFTRTMQRLAAIKDAVSEEHYNALRAGVRSMYMNRRPNLQQMTALMDLLETVLAYVAEDNSLFQRLKSDLAKDKQAAEPAPADEPKMAGAPETETEPPEEPTAKPEMRGLK